MPINQDSLSYIKDNFKSKKEIDDYIELLDKAYLYGIDWAVGRNVVYGLFIPGVSFDAETFVDEQNHWYSNNPPKAYKIINPDKNDELWIQLRKQALAAVLSQKGGRNIGLDENLGLKFLRDRFDKKIPTNVGIDDPSTENAWNKFYSNDQDGTDRAAGLGNGYTLFGYWYSLGVFKDFAINRLKSFNLQNGSVDQGGQVEPPENKVDTSIEDRIIALEEFLVNAQSNTLFIGTATSSLYQIFVSKNNRPELSNSNIAGSESFSLFQGIIAPARGTNLLETSSKYQETLFKKIENSGLLDLLIHADQIRQFGRDRFKNEETVKASAARVVNRS